MAQVEFTPTAQCPYCGEVYPITTAVHYCVGALMAHPDEWTKYHPDRNAGTDDNIANILAELRAIRKLLEKRR